MAYQRAAFRRLLPQLPMVGVFLGDLFWAFIAPRSAFLGSVRPAVTATGRFIQQSQPWTGIGILLISVAHAWLMLSPVTVFRLRLRAICSLIMGVLWLITFAALVYRGERSIAIIPLSFAVLSLADTHWTRYP